MTMPRRPSQPAAAVVLPLRALHEGREPVVVRRPGAPRRIERAPTIREADYHETIAAQADRAIAEDGLVVASLGLPDPKYLIEATMREVAVEAAALRFDRESAVRHGRADAERISSRRVQALLRVAELAVLKEHLRRDSGDLNPAHVTQAVGMLLDTVREVVEDCAEPGVATMFMSRLFEKMRAADFPSSVTRAGTST